MEANYWLQENENHNLGKLFTQPVLSSEVHVRTLGSKGGFIDRLFDSKTLTSQGILNFIVNFIQARSSITIANLDDIDADVSFCHDLGFEQNVMFPNYSNLQIDRKNDIDKFLLSLYEQRRQELAQTWKDQAVLMALVVELLKESSELKRKRSLLDFLTQN